MKFSFDVDKEISILLPSVKKLIITEGGIFNGNERNRTFQGKGITGNYSINGRIVNIVITKNRLLRMIKE